MHGGMHRVQLVIGKQCFFGCHLTRNNQKLQSSRIFVCLFMDGVLNLAGQKTGFDNAQDDQVIPAGLGKGVIHISIQQRNARKSITKVQGINPAVDLEKVLKALKKVRHVILLECSLAIVTRVLQAHSCNGAVVADAADGGNILQLQGDKRHEVEKFLIENGLAEAENIKIHGF
jgi:translation initiation factor 1